MCISLFPVAVHFYVRDQDIVLHDVHGSGVKEACLATTAFVVLFCPLVFRIVHHILDEAWFAVVLQMGDEETHSIIVGPSPEGDEYLAIHPDCTKTSSEGYNQGHQKEKCPNIQDGIQPGTWVSFQSLSNLSVAYFGTACVELCFRNDNLL